MKPASNAQKKTLRKLHQKKYREKEGLFLAEGVRTVEQIIANGFCSVRALFVDESSISTLFSDEIPHYLLSKEELSECSDTENPQGVLALCEMPETAEPESLAGENGIILALDAIQDPGNLGTIYRTAAWFGVKALIAGTGTVDLYNPKVVRSTAGATGSLPYLSGDLQDILGHLRSHLWDIHLLDGNSGAQHPNDISFTKKTVLVTGNEGNGISAALKKTFPNRVKIPGNRSNKVESLNAGIATGIALYHVHNLVDN